MSASVSPESLFLLGDDLLRVVISFLGVDMALPFACVSKSALRVTLLASDGELRTRKECFFETRDLCVYSREVGLWDKMVVDMSMEWVFLFCAEKGLLQGVQFVHSLDPVTYKWYGGNSNPCSRAARGGQIEVLQWLRAEGYPWNECDLSEACVNGHLTTVQWMRSLDPPVDWDGYECYKAAESGNVELMKWLREQDRPWSRPWSAREDDDGWDCMNNAAAGGHFDMVQYLLAQGCEWSEYTCMRAASGGHLEVLQFLRSNQGPSGERKEVCPWNAQECHEEAKREETRERSYGRSSKPCRLVKEWIANNFL
jgi:hypothetical protein